MAYTQNRIFYYCTLLFAIPALIFVSRGEHGDGIIWLSEHRTPFLNSFFSFATQIGEAWTYVLLLTVLLFYRYRYAVLVLVLAIGVPLVSGILKTIFAQPRPSRYFKDNDLFDSLNVIEGVTLHSANTSFPSGHTISAFAVLGFAAFVAKRYSWAGFFLAILAILVAISRVYLVQHFLLDVSVGALLGSIIACFVSWLSIRMQSLEYPWLEKNLYDLRKKTPKA